ncbi:RCC1 domain-containing protein [Streptomyces sp. NPDC055749]
MRTEAYGLRAATGAALTMAFALAATVPAQSAGSDPWVRSWGSNAAGQLGNGSTVGQQTPGSMRDLVLDEVRQLAAGGYADTTAFGAALLKDGTVTTWGNNALGQLGDGTTTSRNTPAVVTGLTGVSRIAAGTTHILALREGKVLAWGGNAYGELGNGRTVPHKEGTENRPVAVQSLDKVKDIGAGCVFSTALRQDGTVWTWGAGDSGRLGTGSNTSNNTPQQVNGLADIVAISTGCQHALALTADGTVKSWGAGEGGRLGNDGVVDVNAPVDVAHLDGVSSIHAGWRHNFAVLDDGTVSAWGGNASGQLGDGTTVDRTTPVPLDALHNVQELVPGREVGVAVLVDQSVVTWGDNAAGQLGNGTVTPSRTPVVALPAGSGATHVAAGFFAKSTYAY